MKIPVMLAVALALLGSLGCPGPLPLNSDPYQGAPYNHSSNYLDWSWYSGASAPSGLWFTQVGGSRYALVGTADGLRIQSLDGASAPINVGGRLPTQGGDLQCDVEVYGSYAYLCSNANAPNPTQGVLIVDLSGLPASAAVAGAFLANDGDPKGINLSIDTARGLLFLQRSQGVEVWNLRDDPQHPAFLARFAAGTPVSDLVAQGSRLYVAEGSARSFSIWDVSVPTQATLLRRWTVAGFANCIWPREDGQAVATVEETPSAPIKFWTVSAQAQVANAGQWSLDGQTLASSIKWKGNQAFIAYRNAGLVVLGVSDPVRPTLDARFDGPTDTANPALRDVRDVMPTPDPSPTRVLLSDYAQGLFQVRTQ